MESNLQDESSDLAPRIPTQSPDKHPAPTEAEDNWATLDAKERRKRQNRINQRAFPLTRLPGPGQRKRAQQHKATIQGQIEEMIARGEVTLLPRVVASVSASSSETFLSTTSDKAPVVTSWDRRMCLLGNAIDKLLAQYSQKAVESYVLGSPSSDQLLTLCQVNVFRAFISIMHTLGMSGGSDWMDEDALSPFSTSLPGYVTADNLPVSLRPTSTQTKTTHHPWLDFFPFPRIRDNLINAGDFDDHPLCLDVMGFWNVTNEPCGLLVWGEPADPRSWEASESFIRKWPWVVAGCPELLSSTNQWRSSRGDKMIFRYL
ncbi:hypothetical protein BJX76DRAFT_345607 [Aspergillus varians]